MQALCDSCFSDALRRCLGEPDDTEPDVTDEKLVCGRFRLGECIGKGGFADVWAAVDVRGKPPRAALALKRLKTPWVDAAGARRAYREISVQQALRHAGLLPLIAVYRDEETTDVLSQTLWIVLPRLELDLHVALRANQIKSGQRHSITLQLLCAVAHLHARGLVHRDLKPVNILLSTAGSAPKSGGSTRTADEAADEEVAFELKLCDFGLVRSVGGPAVAGQFAPPPEIYAGARAQTNGPHVPQHPITPSPAVLRIAVVHGARGVAGKRGRGLLGRHVERRLRGRRASHGRHALRRVVYHRPGEDISTHPYPYL